MASLNILCPAGPLCGEISLPASKSISNRLLIMQRLSDNRISIKYLSGSDDTRLLISLLEKVRQFIAGSFPGSTCALDCENAGTVLRFLTAYLAMQPGRWLLTGSEQMKRRPVGALVRALSAIGAHIEYTDHQGFSPIRIWGRKLSGGEVVVDASKSSQFVTALLMIAPMLEKGLHIEMENEVVSQPYIEMTIALMHDAGIEIQRDDRSIYVLPGSYGDASFFVEPDWSAASYWYEVVALTPGSEILLKGLTRKSVQGDAVLTDIFNHLGVGTQQTDHGILISRVAEPAATFAYNFMNCPDLAPAVAATCAALNMEALLSGLKNLRIKESNRLEALHHELTAINPDITIINNDSLFLPRQKKISIPVLLHFNTYNDHRMAMAFAPLASVFRSISVDDPDVVSKSYPDFWEDFQRVGFTLNNG